MQRESSFPRVALLIVQPLFTLRPLFWPAGDGGRGTFPTSRLLCCSQLPDAQNGCAVRSSLSIKLHSNRVEICGVTRRKCAMFATEIFGRHGANSDAARRLRLNGCAVRLSRRCGDSVVIVRIGLNRRAVHGVTADDKIRLRRITLLNGWLIRNYELRKLNEFLPLGKIIFKYAQHFRTFVKNFIGIRPPPQGIVSMHMVITNYSNFRGRQICRRFN